MVSQKIALLLLFCLSIAACAPQAPDERSAATAVENYYRGLVEQDLALVVDNACAEWEAQARSEFSSFTPLTASLDEDFACEFSGGEVTCTGNIIFEYGEEIELLPLAGKSHAMLQEGGRWRVCGYN